MEQTHRKVSTIILSVVLLLLILCSVFLLPLNIRETFYHSLEDSTSGEGNGIFLVLLILGLILGFFFLIVQALVFGMGAIAFICGIVCIKNQKSCIKFIRIINWIYFALFMVIGIALFTKGVLSILGH